MTKNKITHKENIAGNLLTSKITHKDNIKSNKDKKRKEAEKKIIEKVKKVTSSITDPIKEYAKKEIKEFQEYATEEIEEGKIHFEKEITKFKKSDRYNLDEKEQIFQLEYLISPKVIVSFHLKFQEVF